MEGEEEPRNQDPEIIQTAFTTVIELFQQYGWVILLCVVVIIYLYNKLRPRLSQLAQQREESSYKKMDAGAIQDKVEAMERARRKMQAQLDEQAKEYAQKQKEREEEKRKMRQEDWERHQQGKGYRNKTKPPEDKPSSSKLPKAKKPLKTDYNPLMGDSSGACYRPTRRGGAGGGG